MQYVLLIHAAESRFADATPEARESVMRAYGDFTRDLFATGRAGDCAALQPSHSATTVRVRDGRRVVGDGPFAETREQLGGYYTVDVATPDEALDHAARIPDAQGGTIEVRPVVDLDTRAAPPSSFTDATHRQYILAIYDDPAVWAALTPDERGALMAHYGRFNGEVRASGHFIDGAQLMPSHTARAVSVVDGRRVVRDGPFAETREQLGGYYRVWARDLDEALSLAARIPSASIGTIEVRPVMDTRRYA